MAEEIIGFKEGQDDIDNIDKKEIEVLVTPEPITKTVTLEEKKRAVSEAESLVTAANKQLEDAQAELDKYLNALNV